MYDVEKIRADFPILSRQVNGTDLVYLDSGASAQKPQAVIDTVTEAYAQRYANVHRGLHFLSNDATERFEAVRGKVARFLGARHEDEILFTSNGSEGFNLVSYGWAAPRIEPGDEIILSVMEHHANIVPWHFLRERQGAVLKWLETDARGEIDLDKLADAITPRTRLVAISHMSNVLGTVNPAKRIVEIAHARGVPVLLDGCQAAVHMPVDVADLDVDFYVITGHKLYGPSGSGAVYIRRERQAEMRPFMGGGDMIREVTREGITYNDPPHKFEAGTPNIVQVIGFGAAIDYVSAIGMENIAAHEHDLRDYAQARLSGLNWLQIHGNSATKGAIFSFSMEGGAHPHDISTVIDRKGIAVRAGHHCCQPLMAHLGVTATARASFGLYNTRAEVDRLVEALEFCHELFG
ncbi:cysteine desulfurase [Paralimibaculum aggregatum]|uniref:Cysteine desulfurase n=1 Tax=Paralimibaculum aggregatum TaxID=3036245 RepID=A0ABQ6LQT8_9RHOB|nr:cysteine desulfurase [Limibaculum sp. NKW23]GMG83588.1 cysteine desulfurase [Limibaculum sp. NKW23]